MSDRLFAALFVAAFGLSVSAQDITKTGVFDKSITWNGARIEYLRTHCPEVEAVVVKILPGKSTGIHLHPVNNYAYILKGSIHLEVGDVGSDGKFIRNADHKQADFKEGEAFAEVVNAWHNGTAGPDGVEILVWYTTAIGRAVTVSHATSPDYKIGKALEDDSACEPPPLHHDHERSRK